MEKIIYAQGSGKYPQQVISKLVSYGGRETTEDGGNDDYLYYIDEKGFIAGTPEKGTFGQMLMEYGERVFIEPVYKFSKFDVVTNSIGCNFTISEQLNRNGSPCYKVFGNRNVFEESEFDLLPVKRCLSQEEAENNHMIIGGLIITEDAMIQQTALFDASPENRNVFYDYASVKSALAMAQISQLISKPVYGGRVPFGDYASIIRLRNVNGRICVCIYNYKTAEGGILRFQSEDQARLFLENNTQLVRDYLMVDEDAEILSN